MQKLIILTPITPRHHRRQAAVGDFTRTLPVNSKTARTQPYEELSTCNIVSTQSRGTVPSTMSELTRGSKDQRYRCLTVAATMDSSITQFTIGFDVDGATDPDLVKKWDDFVRTKMMKFAHWLFQFDLWEMRGRDWGTMKMSNVAQATSLTDAILFQVLKSNGIVQRGRNMAGQLIFAPEDVKSVPEEARWED